MPSNDESAIPNCTCDECDKLRKLHGDKSDRQDQVYLLCPPKVPAFSMIKKKWKLVEIEELFEICFQEDMFSKLVVENTHKEVVTCMVESYTKGDLRSSDFVQGKGRGVVILLHGSPGTGKTLTAGKFKTRLAGRTLLTMCRVCRRAYQEATLRNYLRGSRRGRGNVRETASEHFRECYQMGSGLVAR